MKPEEVRAAGRLGARLYGGTITNIEQAHLQIAAAALRHVPASAPVDAVHDVMARAAYGLVRVAGTRLGELVSEAMPLAVVGSGTPVGSKGASNHAIAALNAAIGDRLESERNALAISMAIRHKGRDMALERMALAQVLPDAGGKIAVFLHGLGETEMSWRMSAGPDGQTYGSRLEADFGYTPVYIRYNSGRHISGNGRSSPSFSTRWSPSGRARNPSASSSSSATPWAVS